MSNCQWNKLPNNRFVIFFIIICYFFALFIEIVNKCNYISIKGGEKMNTKAKIQKGSVKFIKKLANHSLKVDANNTTCLTIYQPKAPAALKNFSKINKE